MMQDMLDKMCKREANQRQKVFHITTVHFKIPCCQAQQICYKTAYGKLTRKDLRYYCFLKVPSTLWRRG